MVIDQLAGERGRAFVLEQSGDSIARRSGRAVDGGLGSASGVGVQVVYDLGVDWRLGESAVWIAVEL